MDVSLFDGVHTLGKHGHAHRGDRVNSICRGHAEPAKKLPIHIVDIDHGLEVFPLRYFRQGDFLAESITGAGLKCPLGDFDFVAINGVPLKAGIVGFALREHVTENDIGQVAIIAESDGVQIPIGGIVEIDMPVTDIRLYRHATSRASDLGFAP